MSDQWTRTTLGEVADWYSGGTPKATDRSLYGGPIPWAVIADMDDALMTNTESTITKDALRLIGGRLAAPGAVLMSMYGTIGRVGVAGVPMATNQAIAWAEPHKDRVTSDFLFHWLRHHRQGFDALARGATQRNINRQIIRDFPIDLPPLAEQCRIVDLVAAVDEHNSAARAASSAALSSAEAIVAVMVAKEATSLVALADMLVGIEAGKSPTSEDRQPVGGERAVLKVSAVRPGYFDGSQVKVLPTHFIMPEHARLRDGDILITRANTTPLVASVCRISSAPADYYLCDKTLRLVPRFDKVDADYLVIALRLPSVRRQIENAATGTSGSMKNISQDSIRRLSIPLPPLDVQHAIAVTVLSALAVDTAARAAADRSNALRAALLSDLLSGDHEIPEGYDALLEHA
jgi:type I restriction enzyme S subunit